MTKQIHFIGRDKELSMFESLVGTWNTRYILCIHGSGGIGKTRFLQEIRQKFTKQSQTLMSLRITEIIDFDNPTFHTILHLGNEIAKQLGEKTFEPYQQKVMNFRRMEIVGVGPEKLTEEYKAINKIFAACFNAVSSQQRVIILFDTTDALQGKQDIWDFLMDILPNINNAVFVIAGRDAETIEKLLKAVCAEDVKNSELHPLKLEDSEKYLRQKLEQIYAVLDPDISMKLLILAHGIPILIDLAVEWQTRNIPLYSLIENKVKVEEFECHLIRHIADVRTPLHRLFLVMSRIYPINIPMISKLITGEEAQTLFEEAKMYIFVKSLPDGRLTLHDEMRRMINVYLWDIVDPEKDRQMRDSKIVADYLDEEIKKLEAAVRQIKIADRDKLEISLKIAELEEKQELLTKQRIYHLLFSDLEKGFKEYETSLWNARNSGKVRQGKQLEEVVKPFVNQFSSEQLYKFTVLSARILNDTRQYQNAKRLLEPLLDEDGGNLEREADIRNAIATSEIHMGNLDQALEHQQKCLDIFNRLNKKQFVPNVANQIGYIHQLRGELKESIRYFNIALEAALQSDTPDANIVAGAMNNLGHVLGLEGKYYEGIGYCQQAIQLWTDMNVSKRVGQGEIFLAAILRDQGDYYTAIQQLRKAISRFEEPDDSRWLIMAYRNLGCTQWYQGISKKRIDTPRLSAEKAIEEDIQSIRKQRMLQLATDSFEKSLELAHKYHVKIELSYILGQYGRLCWDCDEQKKARQFVNESFHLSKEVRNIYQAIDSLLAIAEFDYLEKKYDIIATYAQTLRDEYESKGYSYPLFFGRMRRILADIAFEQREYDTALRNYAEAIALIKQHGGYNIYSITEELGALGKKLDTLSPITAYKWITHMKEYWMQQKPVDTYANLQIWCEQQAIRAKFR